MVSEELQLISFILKKRGFNSFFIEKLVEGTNWAFDLFAENEKEAIALDYRKNETVSPIFLDRTSNIKTFHKKLSLFVVFEKIPSPKIFEELSKKGVGILLFRKKELIVLLKSKDFSQKKQAIAKKIKIKKKIKQPPTIYVYPCSIQENKERERICKTIRLINNRHKIAIFDNAPERDRRNGINFERNMIRNMKGSNIFIAALTGEYSDSIYFEIKNCNEHFSNELIFILKKNIKQKELSLEEKIRAKKYNSFQFNKVPLEFRKIVGVYRFNNLIEYIKSKRIKYIPYNSLAEFSDLIYDELIKLIILILKREGFKSPFER